MRNTLATLAVLSLIGLSAGCCSSKNHPAEQPATQPSAAAIPVNTQCMVEKHDKVDPTITYVYQGKTYAFCCTDCREEFKKNPEKYIAAAK